MVALSFLARAFARLHSRASRSHSPDHPPCFAPFRSQLLNSALVPLIADFGDSRMILDRVARGQRPVIHRQSSLATVGAPATASTAADSGAQAVAAAPPTATATSNSNGPSPPTTFDTVLSLNFLMPGRLPCRRLLTESFSSAPSIPHFVRCASFLRQDMRRPSCAFHSTLPR